VSSDTRHKYCTSAFAFLVRDFGFEDPQVQTLGHETFVQFHRGSKTVSISWEGRSPPLVELFGPPTAPADQIVPWAEKNGLPRCRRFPRLRPTTVFRPEDDQCFHAYISELADAIVQEERKWLVA
jgi:hypothetical protein